MGTNYIRHNTFKICIEITNHTYPYDSKVQNTTLKGIQNSSSIHHSASDISKTQTCFCFYHHLSNTSRIQVHDSFMHVFMQD